MKNDKKLKADAMDFYINEIDCLNWPLILSGKDLEILKNAKENLLKMAQYCDDIINLEKRAGQVK